MGLENCDKVRDLTELEGTVLGLIKAKGPCTPYVIRREFLRSPSVFWSGSAGAIYPIIRRLQNRRLIGQVGRPINNRRGKLFAVTDLGVLMLNSWIFRPFDPLVTGTPPDSLRNRIELLGILPMATQKQFLLGVIGALEKQLEICEGDIRLAKGGDLYEYASCRGSLLHAQARLQWIKELSATLNPLC